MYISTIQNNACKQLSAAINLDRLLLMLINHLRIISRIVLSLVISNGAVDCETHPSLCTFVR
ncbi:MAG: hypothetical protein ACI9L9_002778 [Marivirga sp.]|jgi:hypothetical protein